MKDNPSYIRCNYRNGRGDCQMFWHFYFQNRIREGTVLDIGSGYCQIRGRVPGVVCQDIEDYLPVDHCCPFPWIMGHFDWLTAFDVIEHIENDALFIKEMEEKATFGLFLTTPNATFTDYVHPYHRREYNWEEWNRLFQRFDKKKFFAGNADGSVVKEVHGHHDAPHHGVAIWFQ
jgi:hypothetical protein